MSKLLHFKQRLQLRHLYSFAVGTVAGASVGLVGCGGSQVIIPALTLTSFPSIANLSQLSATGVSLTSLSLSTVSSSFRFWKEDCVNIPLAMAIAIPSVLSARMGTRLAQKLSGDALALFFNGFSIILIPTHYWIQQRAQARRKLLQQEEERKRTDCNFNDDKKNIKLQDDWTHLDMNNTLKLCQHATFGLISGIVCSLMGVGGLPLTMSYITEATDLPHHYVQGTAVLAIVPSVLVSATSRVKAIPFAVAGCVCFGAMVGGYVGAKTALSLNEEQLRNLYMTSLVLYGSRSAYGASQNIKRILQKTTSM